MEALAIVMGDHKIQHIRWLELICPEPRRDTRLAHTLDHVALHPEQLRENAHDEAGFSIFHLSDNDAPGLVQHVMFLLTFPPV
jgi:hypothetical protein